MLMTCIVGSTMGKDVTPITERKRPLGRLRHRWEENSCHLQVECLSVCVFVCRKLLFIYIYYIYIWQWEMSERLLMLLGKQRSGVLLSGEHSILASSGWNRWLPV
jgi:hypothetical protein